MLQWLAERTILTKSYFILQGVNNIVLKRTLRSTLYFGDEPSRTFMLFPHPSQALGRTRIQTIALIRGLQPLKHLTSMHSPPGKAGTPPPNPRWAHNTCRLCGLLCSRAEESATFPSSCVVSSVMLTGSSLAERVVFITYSLLTKLSQAYSSVL